MDEENGSARPRVRVNEARKMMSMAGGCSSGLGYIARPSM